MNKYGPKARAKIERTMHEFKKGTLKNASNGAPVKDKDQAIAIGISEAKRQGYKVPVKRYSR